MRDPSPAGPQPRDRPRITVELAVSGPVNDRMALTQTRATTRPAVPCIAVPTTAGTGAEVTANAVLPSPAHRPQGEPAQPADDPAGRAGRSAAHGVLPAAGHRGQRPGRAHPVPGAVRLGPGQPADRRPGGRGAAPRGRGPARRLRRRHATWRRGGHGPVPCWAGCRWPTPSSARCTAWPASSAASPDVPHGIACAALLAPVIEANVRALRSGQPASPPLTATPKPPGC